MNKRNNILPLLKLFQAAGLPGFLLFSRNILYFFITRRRSLDEYSSVDDSALSQIVFIFGIFFISVYILFQNPQKRKILFSSPQIFLLIYVFICFLSMLWTPNLFVTGFRAFESLAYLLLISLVIYNLITKLNSQDIVEWAILWIIWDILWSIATSTKLIGLSYLLWPFQASRLAVPMFFFFALILTKRHAFKYTILAFSILMVSNKVFFGIAFGLIGFFFGNSKYKGWLFLFMISILITLVFVDVEELLKHTLFYGRETVGMGSMSGRDKVWTIAWEAFLQKPMFGYGFVDGETVILYSRFTGAISTHNFLFSGLLGTGLLGTFFLILYFWYAFRKASSKFFPANKFRPVMVSTIIMALVVSSSAPGVGARVYGSWIPVVFVLTLISALRYQFKIMNRIKIIQKITSYENNMGHSKFS